jgi:thiamine biosynthesis lipoprotein
MKSMATLASVVLLAWVGGCSDPRADLQEHRLLAMGTWVDVVWEGPETINGQYPQTVVEAELRVYEQQYYPWADGELAALNAALATGQSFQPSPEMERLLALGQQYYRQSGGSFDPGIGGLVDAWGFGDDPNPSQQHRPPPAAASIQSLKLSNGTATSTDTNLVVDLGGYAKGDAVDKSLELLAQLGLENMMVNAGGDLRVIGQRAGAPWRVGVLNPRDTQAVLGSLWLISGEAAFTSGDYVRAATRDGVRTHHLIDPTTAAPALHTQAITVIADNGTLADAGATAIFVAGPNRWLQVADDLGIDKVLRISNHGEVQITVAMAERFTPVAGVSPDVIMRHGH